jgi:hypothetical protein
VCFTTRAKGTTQRQCICRSRHPQRAGNPSLNKKRMHTSKALNSVCVTAEKASILSLCVLQRRQGTKDSRAICERTGIAGGAWLGTAKHSPHITYKQSKSQQSTQKRHLRKQSSGQPSIHMTSKDTHEGNNQMHGCNTLAIPPQIATCLLTDLRHGLVKPKELTATTHPHKATSHCPLDGGVAATQTDG